MQDQDVTPVFGKPCTTVVPAVFRKVAAVLSIALHLYTNCLIIFRDDRLPSA
jgi:hypothetical protein